MRFIFSLLFISIALQGAEINGFLDLSKISAPANPASTRARLFVDSGTNQLTCLTSAGASCLTAGGGGNPGGSTLSVQYNAGSGAFGGNSVFAFNPTLKSVVLSGGGLNEAALVIIGSGSPSGGDTLARLSFTPDTSALSVNAQVHTFGVTLVATGDASVGSIGTLSGPYVGVTDSTSAGTITHFLGTVSRVGKTSTSTDSLMAAYYGDGVVTGAGTVAVMATFHDNGRIVPSGATVGDSIGLNIFNTTGTGVVANDYGVHTQPFCTPGFTGKGTNNNIGFYIGNSAVNGTCAGLVQSDGPSYFTGGTTFLNFNPPANADFAHLNSSTLVGASTGTTIGAQFSQVGNPGGGQTLAGFTGAKVTNYNGGAGTLLNQIGYQFNRGGNNPEGGPVTNSYGFKVDDAGLATYTITNSYGVYIGNNELNGVFTNGPWSFFSSDARNILTNKGDAQLRHISSSQAAPAVSGCGSGATISSDSGDSGGTVTAGSVATGCVITFQAAYGSAPHCTVTSRNAVTLTYTSSTTALTITAAGVSSSLLDYVCLGR